jgi:hypothetical protein
MGSEAECPSNADGSIANAIRDLVQSSRVRTGSIGSALPVIKNRDGSILCPVAPMADPAVAKYAEDRSRSSCGRFVSGGNARWAGADGIERRHGRTSSRPPMVVATSTSSRRGLPGLVDASRVSSPRFDASRRFRGAGSGGFCMCPGIRRPMGCFASSGATEPVRLLPVEAYNWRRNARPTLPGGGRWPQTPCVIRQGFAYGISRRGCVPVDPDLVRQDGRTNKMNLAASLVAVSLLLLLGLAVAVFFFAGRDSRSANEDDPPPR